ncbi:hypothetical protein [Ekhidna sp.]|uniref:hypothetical protein n=1 Tax=Ekhidna sp. TaxID=2608089 RepID=UPI0032F07E1E
MKRLLVVLSIISFSSVFASNGSSQQSTLKTSLDDEEGCSITISGTTDSGTEFNVTVTAKTCKKAKRQALKTVKSIKS